MPVSNRSATVDTAHAPRVPRKWPVRILPAKRKKYLSRVKVNIILGNKYLFIIIIIFTKDFSVYNYETIKMCSPSDCYKVIFVVILVLVRNSDCRSTTNKFRRTSGVQYAWNHLQSAEKNSTIKEQGRGFFGKLTLSINND